MTTRNLIALGTMLTIMALAGTGFAADQKAAGTQAPAATAGTPAAPDSGTHPDKSSKKKKKHSSTSGATTTPAPKN